MKVLLDTEDLHSAVNELAGKILLKHPAFEKIAIVGIQQGGVVLADELVKALRSRLDGQDIPYGQLDITFYRDDLHSKILAPDEMNIPFPIDNLHVILVDDVLFTGRTIKAALDVLLDYGRPARVELCVLVDRKEHRQFPIQADFSSLVITTDVSEKVKLVKGENGKKQVILITKEKQ